MNLMTINALKKDITVKLVIVYENGVVVSLSCGLELVHWSDILL